MQTVRSKLFNDVKKNKKISQILFAMRVLFTFILSIILPECCAYNAPHYTHKLARDNFKLVPYFAKPFMKRHKLGKYEREELLQEGYIGLILACRKYDPTLNVTISTYSSYWIKSYINKYLKKKYRLRTHVSLDPDRYVVPSTEILIELTLLLDKLNEFEQGLVRRRFCDKLTIDQLAIEYGVPSNTILRYFRQIRKKIHIYC